MGKDEDRRKLAVTDSYAHSSIGKNFKGLDEELKKKEVMKIGSLVYIIGGTH